MSARLIKIIVVIAVVALFWQFQREHNSDTNVISFKDDNIATLKDQVQSLKSQLAEKPCLRFYGVDPVHGHYDIRSFDDRRTWYMIDPMAFSINKRVVILGLADEKWPGWLSDIEASIKLREELHSKGLAGLLANPIEDTTSSVTNAAGLTTAQQ